MIKINDTEFNNLFDFVVSHKDVKEWCIIGSSKIPGAAVDKRSDVDLLILVPMFFNWKIYKDLDRLMLIEGIGHYGSPTSPFISFRERHIGSCTRPMLNVIVTRNQKFYKRMRVAQKICEDNWIADRPARLKVFDSILDL